VVEGTGVCDPISEGGRMQRHGVEAISKRLLIPGPHPRMPGWCGHPELHGALLLLKEGEVDRNRH
jgi:hypothetical protein